MIYSSACLSNSEKVRQIYYSKIRESQTTPEGNYCNNLADRADLFQS